VDPEASCCLLACAGRVQQVCCLAQPEPVVGDVRTVRLPSEDEYHGGAVCVRV